MRICHPFCCVVVALAIASQGCRAIGHLRQNRPAIEARKLSREGQRWMYDGNWDAAEAKFAAALNVSDDDDRAHWGLAEALWQRGEYEEALQHMEQAVRLSADDPMLLSRLGRMDLELGRLDAADRRCEQALAANRNSAENWVLRGDCLAARQQWDESLSAYHRALAIQPDLSAALLKAAEVYHRQGRYDRLLASMDRMRDHVGETQTPARADVLRGIALRQLGRPWEAQRCFVAAVQKDDSNHAAYLLLASQSVRVGDLERARQALAESLRLNPSLRRDEDVLREFQHPSLAAVFNESSATEMR
ncbi:tetratricopeptide repeat protein [Crateriforma conspicua]|uniref:Tetratricopeptide repeat protein n=1 Tax=Crateriforma conspicua TaxID=2527996 RepID=A0A5C5Y5A9_9PLAN|nr:tetratricopeptide repeat protein [Crateriforma conspicua]TWT70906.1 tetratricopeptide repeat protein [Crateriforma conspicua]